MHTVDTVQRTVKQWSRHEINRDTGETEGENQSEEPCDGTGEAGKQKRDNKMTACAYTGPAIWSWKLKYNHQMLVLSTTLLIASYAR